MKALLLTMSCLALATAQLDMTSDRMGFEDNIAEESSNSAEAIFAVKPILNDGKPFFVARDPNTGNFDFNMKKTAGIPNDIPRVTKDELSGFSKSGHDIASLGNDFFHDKLNLPVKYSSSKSVYPLISGSYANLKYQGNNKNQDSNHKNYTSTLGTTQPPKYYTHIRDHTFTATFKHPTTTAKTPEVTTAAPTKKVEATTFRAQSTSPVVVSTTTPQPPKTTTIKYSSTIVQQNQFPSTFKNYVDSADTRRKPTTSKVFESSTPKASPIRETRPPPAQHPVKFVDEDYEKYSKPTTYRPPLSPETRLSFSTSMPILKPSGFKPVSTTSAPKNQSHKIVFETGSKNPSVMSLSDIFNSITKNDQDTIPYDTAESSNQNAQIEIKTLPPVITTTTQRSASSSFPQRNQAQYVDLPVYQQSQYPPQPSPNHIEFPSDESAFEDYVEFENPADSKFANQYVKYEVHKPANVKPAPPTTSPNPNLVAFKQIPSINNVVISPSQNSATFVLGSQQSVGSVGVGSSMGVGTNDFVHANGHMKVGQVINDEPPVRLNQMQSNVRFPSESSSSFDNAQIVKGTIKMEGSASDVVQPPQALSQNKPAQQQPKKPLVFPSQPPMTRPASHNVGGPIQSGDPNKIIFENVNDIYEKVNDKKQRQEVNSNEQAGNIAAGELRPPSQNQQPPQAPQYTFTHQQQQPHSQHNQHSQQNQHNQHSQHPQHPQQHPHYTQGPPQFVRRPGPNQMQNQNQNQNQQRPPSRPVMHQQLPNILPQFRPNQKSSHGHPPPAFQELGSIRIPSQYSQAPPQFMRHPYPASKIGLPSIMSPPPASPAMMSSHQPPMQSSPNPQNFRHGPVPTRKVINRPHPQYPQESANRRVYRPQSPPANSANDLTYMRPPPVNAPNFQLKRILTGKPETLQMLHRPQTIPQQQHQQHQPPQYVSEVELNKSLPPAPSTMLSSVEESEANGTVLEPVVTLQMLQSKKSSGGKLNLPPVQHDASIDHHAASLPSNHKEETGERLPSKQPSVYVVYPVQSHATFESPQALREEEKEPSIISEYQNTPFSVVSHFEQEPLLMKKDKKKQPLFPYHLEKPAKQQIEMKSDVVVQQQQRPAEVNYDPSIYNIGEQPMQPNGNYPADAISSKLVRATERPIAIAYTPTEPSRVYTPTSFYRPNNQYSHYYDPHLSSDKNSNPNFGRPELQLDFSQRPQYPQQPQRIAPSPQKEQHEHFDFQAPFQASVSVNPEVTNPYEGWAVVTQSPVDTNKIDRSDSFAAEEETTKHFDLTEFQPHFESGFKPIYSERRVSLVPEILSDSDEMMYVESDESTEAIQAAKLVETSPATTVTIVASSPSSAAPVVTSTTTTITPASIETSSELSKSTSWSSDESTTQKIVKEKKKLEIDSLEAFFDSLTRDYEDDNDAVSSNKSENESRSL